MASYDSSYLLAMFNRLAGRPSSGDAITDVSKYQRLTEAQNEVVADIASICPNVLYPTVAYSALPTMTTTDQQVFTFGNDANGYSITPIGKVAIFASLNDIPSNPLVPGVDFLPMGGTAIRAPNNGTITGTLYWLGITNPTDIDASHQPALFPEAARELIVIRAVYNFAGEANRNPDLAAAMGIRYGKPLAQIPGRFAYWCATWRTQFRGGGALRSLTGMQLAVSTQSGAA